MKWKEGKNKEIEHKEKLIKQEAGKKDFYKFPWIFVKLLTCQGTSESTTVQEYLTKSVQKCSKQSAKL